MVKNNEGKNAVSQIPAKAQHGVALPGNPKTVLDIFKSDYFVKELSKMVSKYMTPETLLRVANTAVMKEGKLQRCTPISFWNCLVDLYTVQLAPDGTHAHILPYGDKATLLIDYKGFVQIILRDQNVLEIHGQVVCEDEEFVHNAATGIVERHTIDFKKPRDKMYAAYTCVTYRDGNRTFHVMGKDEIEKTRNEAAAWKNWLKNKKKCPWNTHEGEMWKKTVLHQHKKWLRLTPETRRDLAIDESHQFPQYSGTETISESDIRNMDDGARMSIKKTAAEPEKETSEVIDAETTDKKGYPDKEVMIESFADMGEVQFDSVCEEAGVQVVAGKTMTDEDIRKVYDVIQKVQKGGK